MALKQLPLHRTRHLETIAAISSLIWISSKALLLGRWQEKKILNVQHGHFSLISWNTLAASKIGTAHDFSTGTDPHWEHPSHTGILMKEPVSEANFALVEKNLSILHFWVEWQDGKDKSWGHTKESSSTYFLKSKGLPNSLDTNIHYQSKILIQCPLWNTGMVNSICQISAPTFPLLR